MKAAHWEHLWLACKLASFRKQLIRTRQTDEKAKTQSDPGVKVTFAAPVAMSSDCLTSDAAASASQMQGWLNASLWTAAPASSYRSRHQLMTWREICTSHCTAFRDLGFVIFLCRETLNGFIIRMLSIPAAFIVCNIQSVHNLHRNKKRLGIDTLYLLKDINEAR